MGTSNITFNKQYLEKIIHVLMNYI